MSGKHKRKTNMTDEERKEAYLKVWSHNSHIGRVNHAKSSIQQVVRNAELATPETKILATQILGLMDELSHLIRYRVGPFDKKVHYICEHTWEEQQEFIDKRRNRTKRMIELMKAKGQS